MLELNPEEIQFLERLRSLQILSKHAGDDAEVVYLSSLRLELPFLDYMTVRDLIEFGEYPEDTPLL